MDSNNPKRVDFSNIRELANLDIKLEEGDIEISEEFPQEFQQAQNQAEQNPPLAEENDTVQYRRITAQLDEEKDEAYGPILKNLLFKSGPVSPQPKQSVENDPLSRNTNNAEYDASEYVEVATLDNGALVLTPEQQRIVDLGELYFEACSGLINKRDPFWKLLIDSYLHVTSVQYVNIRSNGGGMWVCDTCMKKLNKKGGYEHFIPSIGHSLCCAGDVGEPWQINFPACDQPTRKSVPATTCTSCIYQYAMTGAPATEAPVTQSSPNTVGGLIKYCGYMRRRRLTEPKKKKSAKQTSPAPGNESDDDLMIIMDTGAPASSEMIIDEPVESPAQSRAQSGEVLEAPWNLYERSCLH